VCANEKGGITKVLSTTDLSSSFPGPNVFVLSRPFPFQQPHVYACRTVRWIFWGCVVSLPITQLFTTSFLQPETQPKWLQSFLQEFSEPSHQINVISRTLNQCGRVWQSFFPTKAYPHSSRIEPSNC
jgi:hypothetical protein